MRLKKSALPAFTLLALCCQQAQAGGIILYEIGTDNAGLANAGAAARAQGPSTIASNPAGMSYLSGTQVTGGLQVLYGNLTFSRDGNTNGSGTGSGNALDPIPGGSFFITHQLDDNWSVGFGAYGDFGLAANYKNDWSGRYFAQDASLGGLSLVPSVAYRFNEQWSVGLGVKAMYGMLQTQTAIDRSPFGLTDRNDGQFKYQDTTWGYGANLGVIYAPQPGTRIGLAYTSKVDLNFEDKLNVHGDGPLLQRLDGLNTKLDMQVPQTATLSLFQQLDAQWAFLATVNWQDWSQFGNVAVQVDTTAVGAQSTTVNAHYKDTWQLALGTQYQATPKLLWNAGVAYDSSAVSDANRTFTAPMGESWRLATGATYALNKDTDVNVSWALVWLGDMPVDQTKSTSGIRTSGQFDNAWIQAITGNMTWRF
ncbi:MULTISPECIES: OmpP1/FadL family transporter [unclassified Pseudomonas]|uniref:OmpP1/FadL family transporter n=1 Tax=unclassified Pseudomonas TaxID=196821 RepID=UPI002AC8DB45|nr:MULTISPECIES: outer membrane protein transport protein [unclassified Pseudomonas]MEB0045909.1 outer membrane protein transport protein [Pseudomonas sp. Dout3]MEB0097169.1 outer membrane protein transport protein [Pseudomonas sp. DC1.2]WPX56893.1 outer membrane protein transport protein [Pseudomonas sp. DC1.2]